MNQTWTVEEIARLKTVWSETGGRVTRVARLMGKTKGQISGKSRILGLQFHGGNARIVGINSLASREGLSVHHGRVRDVSDLSGIGVLKPGDNQRKLGPRVMKGAWKGMPIFSLTLEERATCPRSCKQWTTCYGNNMGLAKRYAHGPQLEERIILELARLQRRHRRGFVVRLHILGDFYSARYVSLWRCCLAAFPALHVFGYTARDPGSAIGRRIAGLNRNWHRFAIRFSGAGPGVPRTVVVPDSAMRLPDSAIICPAQLGKTKNCGTCALCWSPAARERTITFLQH